MKLTEFRVGNNVFHTSHPDTVFEIKDIDRYNNEIGLLDDGYYVKLDTAGLLPIPLTNELLLENCGFYRKEGSFISRIGLAYEDSSFPCDLQQTGDGFQICRSGIGAITAPAEYLHQLQNLYYALTGKELTLTF